MTRILYLWLMREYRPMIIMQWIWENHLMSFWKVHRRRDNTMWGMSGLDLCILLISCILMPLHSGRSNSKDYMKSYNFQESGLIWMNPPISKETNPQPKHFASKKWIVSTRWQSTWTFLTTPSRKNLSSTDRLIPTTVIWLLYPPTSF